MSDPFVFTVGKADSVGKEPTTGAVLNITADLRTVRETLPHAIWRAANLDIHKTDAQQVVAALAHLPQGTVDQVLVLLLEQRASLLRVRVPESFAPLSLEVPEAFRDAVAVGVKKHETLEDLPAAIWAALAAAREGA